MVSGYSYYDSKHKIIMGMVVLLTRYPQLMQINFCSRQNCKFLFDYQCRCLVMEQSIWIVLTGND